MPAKKGTKYLNAKTYSVLSKYTPEDIQKLLNSGQFKSVIARTLGVAACFRNESGSLSSVKTGSKIKGIPAASSGVF